MQLHTDKDKRINYIIDLKSKLKDRFKVLKKKGKISEKELDSIRPVGTSSAILYGSPKVHWTVFKNTRKFQPIASAINIPTYLLMPSLCPLVTNEYNVKKSFNFLEEVVNYNHNLYMTSLDVVSLFTSIPL